MAGGQLHFLDVIIFHDMQLISKLHGLIPVAVIVLEGPASSIVSFVRPVWHQIGAGVVRQDGALLVDAIGITTVVPLRSVLSTLGGLSTESMPLCSVASHSSN